MKNNLARFFLVIGFFISFQTYAVECQGPYLGKKVSQPEIDALMTAKMPDQIDLCGSILHKINFSHLELSQVNFNGTVITESDFSYSNLNQATFYQSKISKTDFISTQAKQANFGNSYLIDVKFEGAILKGSDFSNCTISATTFEEANLENANLNHAVISSSNFTLTRLVNVQLTDTSFVANNFQKTIYQPNLATMPLIHPLSTNQNFTTITFENNALGKSAIKQLSTHAHKENLRQFSRDLSAITHIKSMQEGFHQGPLQWVKSLFKYILFYITTYFGACPWQSLLIVLILYFLFTPFYYAGLKKGKPHFGVLICYASLTHRHRQFCKMQNEKRSFYQSWLMAYYMSLLTSLRYGFGKYTLSALISNLQQRDYELYPIGHLRTIAGIQRLLCIYLITLFLLTLFGHPFNG